MDASTEDTMDTVASTGKVSQTLQTNPTLCVFVMLHTAQSCIFQQHWNHALTDEEHDLCFCIAPKIRRKYLFV